MRSALFLAMAAAAADGVVSASLTSMRLLRLRGGDSNLIEEQLKRQGNIGPLSREEIVEKLNAVPTFCIMQDDGSVISLPDLDGEESEECCTWFTDAAEAQATLKQVKLVSHRGAPRPTDRVLDTNADPNANHQPQSLR